MKKILFGILIIIISSQGALAQSCREKVQNHYRNELRWMHSSDYVSGTSGAASLGVMGSFFLAAGLASPLTFWITMPIGVGVIVYDMTAGYDRKEDRYETMVDLGSAQKAGTKFFNKLVKKAQKINPEITSDEVAQIIQDGFESGELCNNRNFVRPNRLKRYVIKTVKGSNKL
jgi:hypothetical protein